MGSALIIIGRYLRKHKLIGFVGSYLLLSVLLKSFLHVDITIPCLWKSIFNFSCPGCGLTTASIKMTKWDISGAYQANPLLFLILPSGVFYFVRDFSKFKKEVTK